MIRVEKDSWNWSTCSQRGCPGSKPKKLIDFYGILWKNSRISIDSLSQYLSAGAQNFTSLPVEEAFRVPPRTKVPELEFAPRWLFVAAVHHSPRYFSDKHWTLLDQQPSKDVQLPVVTEIC